MIKKIAYTIMLLLLTIAASAQNAKGNERKFDPDKFRQEQEAFITKEAKLNTQEASRFFPLFREMQNKQRTLFHKQRQYAKSKPQNDKEAAKIIVDMDQTELQIKKLQTDYHNKFCKVIPATKVFLCLQAEEKFKRRIMDKMASRRQGNNHHSDKGKKK